MTMYVTSRNCWICEQPALDENNKAIEPFEPNVAIGRIAHKRCAPLAELARRSVYQAVADGSRPGPTRGLKLHVRTGGAGGANGVLLCKNFSDTKRRMGTVREFGGVDGFALRDDACAVCAREYAEQVANARARIERAHPTAAAL